MNTEFTLTVKDVLQRPLFQKARVMAGANGLDRKVRWVHILEISNFDTLIHGEEMILSTGVGLQWGVSSKTGFLEKLIRHGASCLCLELGHYFESVPDEMIQIADRHNFPLIVFHETVRFVDITQDLHSLIINRHHKMLEDLETISRELNRLTLTSQGKSNILKLLYGRTGAQVLYLPKQGNPQFIPAAPPDKQTEIIECIEKKFGPLIKFDTIDPAEWKLDDKTFLVQPVSAMDQTWGHLILIFNDREPEEFDLLVLDRASVSVAQDELRKRYMEERRLHAENVWVDDLIQQRITKEEEIKSLLGSRFKVSNDLQFRVCLIEISNVHELEEDIEAIRLHIALIARSAFEKFEFLPLMTAKSSQLVVVAIDSNSKKPQKDRLYQILHLIQSACAKEKMGHLQLQIGIGRPYNKFVDSHRSFQEAVHVLKLRSLYHRPVGFFYEDIGLYRFLLQIEDTNVIQSFIDDYLGRLIAHDRSKGRELLKTLKVYLDNDGSKQLSSQKLFITRQTLYHRLNKIQELLGEDFMLPEKRLSIEVALCAYQLMDPDSFL